LEASFFREQPHPYVTKETLPVEGDDQVIMWDLIEDEGVGYWDRRKNNNWTDLPNLWGPFEEHD